MTPDPVTFLLVDDTPQNLVALEALLRREGLQILKAQSGPEALELLLVHDVALAFLDVQMPGMDGFELAELMRGAERTRHVPIIFVTAASRDPQRVFQGYEAGAVDFLFKPIDPHVLKSKADVFFELNRQRAALQNALRLNEMFVGILGHDLRNPLNTLVSGAQVLAMSLEDEKHLVTLRRMGRAGQRMTEMIEQLLDLTRARLGSGMGFVRERKLVDVGELVTRTVDELSQASPDRKLAVETRGDATATGDAGRLLQLFSNLVSNALQHGVPGTPVLVSAEGTEREVVVRVRNQGVIPPEALPTLFDPFRGRHTVRARGLGLGLFIAEQIAGAHGGSVSVSSTAEAGTTFTVRLPRRALGPATAPREHRGKTVLVVEDDEDVREPLREAFTAEGYNVLTASNGAEALQQLARAAPLPDAVILDLVLPVVDGQQVYAAMQADPVLAKIPVVVSTIDPRRAPGGTIVVPKPLRLQQLLDTVGSLW